MQFAGPVEFTRMAKENKESIITVSAFLYLGAYLVLGIGGISFQAQPAAADYQLCGEDPPAFDHGTVCHFDCDPAVARNTCDPHYTDCSQEDGSDCPADHCDGNVLKENYNPQYCGSSGISCEADVTDCTDNNYCESLSEDSSYSTYCKDGDVYAATDYHLFICDSSSVSCEESGEVEGDKNHCEKLVESCGSGETCDSGSCIQECTDADDDGYYAQSGCGTEVDCDDSDSSVNPGASEVCDGKDNDCDGSVDESSEVCSGNDACSYSGACDESGTTSQCIYDTNFGVYTCSDEVDSSCSRSCAGDCGSSCTVGTGACENTGTVQCDGSCSASPGSPSSETCNGVDDDCDGQTDEGDLCSGSDVCVSGSCCVSNYGDSCGTDTGVCSSGTIQCDGTCSGSGPTEDPETSCSDGLDNDCDGDTDEEDSDCNTPPTADFDYSPTEPVETQDTDFDGSPSSDPDGSVSSYEWDWTSDGTYEDTGQTATHAFSPEGDYDVTLRVTDDDGATGTDTQTVNVQDGDLTVTADADQTPTSDPREEVIYTVSGNTDGISCSASGAGVSWVCSAGTCEPQSDMADGDHTVTVECTNTYGFSDSDDAPLTVDTTPPSVTCDECDFPDPVKSGEDVTFDPTLNDSTTSVSSMEVCQDAGGSPDCTEIYCEDSGADPESCSYTTPDDTFDTEDYWVRATDEVGNTASPVGPNSFTMKKEEGESCESDEACLLGDCGEDPETGQSVCEATVIPEPGIFLSFIG